MTGPSFSQQVHNVANILAGDFPSVELTVVIESGQNLSAGALLGRVTASGEFKLSLSGAVDGSQTPRAVLIEDADASAAAERAGIYVSGEFDESRLTFGTGHTADSTRWDLAEKGIYLKTAVQT